MAGGLQYLDIGFPHFTGEESQRQKVDAIYNYLDQMRTGMKFTLGTLHTSVDQLKNKKTELASSAEIQMKLEELEARIAMLENGGVMA